MGDTMKASEMIAALNLFVKENGDLPIAVYYKDDVGDSGTAFVKSIDCSGDDHVEKLWCAIYVEDQNFGRKE
jgi:hypothetical protein